MEESRDQKQKSADLEAAAENASNTLSFDKILQEIGEFGLYQLIIGILTGIALLFAAISMFNFVFSASVPDHRCWIWECEPLNTNSFEADWLKLAIPYKDERPEKCLRYQYIEVIDDGTCSADSFNTSNRFECDQFVTKNHEDRLASRLNMLCTGQDSKMALIGTASTIGRFVAMPVSGILSDKFGRLITIIGCAVFGALFSCLQALPPPLMSFELYAALEFLVCFSVAGILGTCFVYNMEWVTAKHRVYLNVITSFTNGFGSATIGLVAWYFESNFVAYKLILGIPGFFIIGLYFILSESPRWLLARHNYTKAIESIQHAGKINGRPLLAKTIEQIRSQALFAASSTNAATNSADEQRNAVTIRNLLAQKTLLFRLIILSIVWLFSLFAYYGIILGSVRIHENKYLSYIIVGLAEIPGGILTIFMLDRIGRRLTIGIPLLVYGFLLAVSIQLAGMQVYQLIVFIICKAAISITMIALCAYTTELWPTAIRNTAFNICSMAGRVGSIFASLSVLLVEYHVHLPTILYGAVTIVSAVLLFVFLPETANCKKLPDTLEESLAIGKHTKKSSTNL